jgi:hypothetical protein
MAWAVAFLTKPEILEQLEGWFDPSDPERLVQRYDEAIAALEDPEPRRWLAVAEQAGLDRKTAGHFETHWLGESDRAYWSSITRDETVEKIRHGFRDAMITARHRGLPISYVWVTPDGLSKDYFEVGHVAGPNGVTAVIVTATPEVLSEAL